MCAYRGLAGKISKAIMEGLESTKATNRIVKLIYRNTEPFSKSMYHDSGWQNVGLMVNAIKDTEGIIDVSVNAGEYHNYFSDSPYRTYDWVAETEYGTEVEGVITCHSAGSVEDPFSAYDMTCQCWRKQ